MFKIVHYFRMTNQFGSLDLGIALHKFPVEAFHGTSSEITFGFTIYTHLQRVKYCLLGLK